MAKAVKRGRGGNPYNDENYSITAQYQSQCESNPVVDGLTSVVTSEAPVITSTSLTESSTSISGTSNSSGSATIYVYHDRIQIGTTTAASDGSWTLSGISSGTLEDDKEVFARAIDNIADAQFSANSNTVIVGEGALEQSEPPVILGSYLTTTTTISGTTVEGPGTIIRVLVNGFTEDQTTADAYGNWEVTGVDLSADGGNDITATAKAEGKSVSGPSDAVTIQTTAGSAPTIEGGATSLTESGFSGAIDISGSGTFRIYIDGQLALTTTSTSVSLSTTSSDGTNTLADLISAGVTVYATAQQSGTTESGSSNVVTVTSDPVRYISVASITPNPVPGGGGEDATTTFRVLDASFVKDSSVPMDISLIAGQGSLGTVPAQTDGDGEIAVPYTTAEADNGGSVSIQAVDDDGYAESYTASFNVQEAAPVISNVSLGNDGSDNIAFSFDADKQLGSSSGDIAVSISGPSNGSGWPKSYNRSNFSEADNSGTYTYTLTATQAYDDGDGTYTATINDAKDSSGLDGGDGSDTDTYVLSTDTTSPTVDIQGEPSIVNSTSAFSVTVEFSEDVSGFTVGDITVGNGSAGNFASTDGNTYTADITPDGNGDITIDVAADVAQDGAGNNNTAATQATVTYDATAPVLSAPNLGNDGSDKITFSFSSDEVLGTATGDLAITVTGPGSYSQSFDRDDFDVSGSGPYTYTLKSASSVAYGDDGTYTAAIDDAVDAAGNDGGDGSDTDTYSLDTTAPSGYAVAWDTDPVNSANEGAAGFSISSGEDGADYAYSISSDGGGTNVTGSGTMSGTSQAVTGVDVSGLSDGTLTVSVTLTDSDGNAGSAATDEVTKETASPQITGLSGSAGDATSSKTIDEGITAVGTMSADESVSWSISGGADSGDLGIDSSTGAITFNSAPDYESPADDDTGNDYVIEVTATDGAGNTATQTVTINITDVDEVAPVFENATPSATNADPDGFELDTDIDEAGTIYYVVVANGASAPSVSQVKAGNDASGSAATDAGSQAVSSGDFTHTFTINGLSSSTDYDVYVVAEDDEDTPNVQSSVTKVDVSTTSSDTISPTISNGSVASDNSYIDVTFSEGIYSGSGGSGALTTDDLSLTFTQNGGSATAASISSLTTTGSGSLSGGETTIRVMLNITGTPSGEETVAISPADGASVYDGSGNAALSTTSTGNKSLNDKVQPTLSNVSLSNDGSDNLSLSFDSDEQLGSSTSDIAVSIDGPNTNNVYSFNRGDFSESSNSGTYTYTLTTSQAYGDGDGTYTAAIDDAKDAAGNDGGDGTDTDSYDFDGTAPQITGLSGSAGDATSSKTIDEGITAVGTMSADESVSWSISGGADSGDLGIDSSTGAITFNSAPDYESPADDDTGNDYVIEVTATDGAGNTATQTVTINITDVDEVAPVFENATPSISNADSDGFDVDTDIDEAGTIYYVVVADGASAPSVSQVKSGNDSGDSAALSSGSQTVSSGDFTHGFSVSGLSSSTDYDVYVVAEDDESTPNVQSSVTKVDATTGSPADTTSPTVDIQGEPSIVNSTSAFSVTVEFSEDVSGFTVGDITVGNGSAGNFASTDGNTYTADITPDGNGDITIDVAADVAQDGAGNNNTAATQATVTYDATAPVLSAPNLGNDGSDKITFSFSSDEVLGTATGDLAITVTGPGSYSQSFDRDDFDVSGSGPYTYTLKSASSVAYGDDGTYTAAIDDAVDAAGNDGGDGSDTDTYSLDTTAPSGYAVAWDTDPVNSANEGAAGFSISSGEDGADYAYSISSDGGGTNVTGSGTMSGTSQAVTGVDVSGLSDGTLTVSVTLTDSDGNAGSAATDEVTKETASPQITGLSGSAGDATSSKTIDEGITAVGTMSADESVSWSISGGADSGDLGIDSSTGAITFNSAPDYESPADDDTGNDYVIEVTATDGAGNTATQTVTINITDVDEVAPVFENATPSATNADPDGFELDTDIDEAGTIYYVVVANGASAPSVSQVKAGNDASGSAATDAGSQAVSSGDFTHTFTINGLSSSTDYDVYVVAEDDEDTPNVQSSVTKVDVSTTSSDTISPTISNGSVASDNSYIDVTFSEGIYSGSGGSGALTTDDLSLTFTQNGGSATAASISSLTTTGSGSLSGGETTIRVMLNITGTPSGEETVAISPADGASVYDGSGNAALSTTSTGNKSLNDKVQPTLSNVSLSNDGSDNLSLSFDSDEQLGSSTSDIAVSIDGPNTNNVYSFNRGDFSESSNSGTYTYTLTTSQAYGDGDGTYTAAIDDAKDAAGNDGGDGTDTDSYDFDGTAPQITGLSGSAGDATSSKTIDEGITAVGTMSADESVSWSISGGADSGDLGIDSSTGAITFNSAPDYESPADDDTGNDYVIEVTATDGAGNTATQTVTINITDVDEVAPVLSVLNLGNDGSGNVSFSFASDEELGTSTSDIAVSLGGPSGYSQTFDRDDFTQSGSSPYTYTLKSASAPAYGDDGTYTATINDAKDAAGNDGGDGSDTDTYELNSVPTINTWPTASDITYGDALSSSTLSGGSASVAGSFAFTTPSAVPGSAGTYSASVTFTPDDTGNYSNVTGSVDVTVNKKALTVTGASASDKTYDSNTDASISGATLSGVVGSDDVSLSSSTSGTFAQAGVGTGIAVSTSMGLTGADAGNYSLSQPAGLNGDITAKELTIGGSFTASDKTYDGGTSSSAASNSLSLSGVESGDTVSLDNITLAFASSDVATGITISITAATISGTDAANYSISTGGAPTTTADITPKGLTVTGAVAQDKTYDGNTDASISGATLNGVVSGDVVSLTNATSGTFGQAGVGTDIAVSTSMGLTGADAGNYSLSQPAGLKADITTSNVTVSSWPTASDITYGDALSSSTLSGGSASVAGSFAFTTPSAVPGSAGTYSASVTFTPDDTGNYSNVTGSVDVTVNKKALTVTGASASDKTYDSNTDASISGATLSGVVGSDDVSLSSSTSGTFAQAGVGTGIAVSTSMGLNGTDAGNYTINQPGSLSADITVKALTVTGASASDKTYDSNTDASISGATLSGVVGSDDVSLSSSTSGTFAQAVVGTGIAVSTSMGLTGADAGNYSLSQPAGLNGDITAKELTIGGSFTASDKTYDGNTTASMGGNSLSLTGVESGDTVTFDEISLAFASSDVASGITVTISGATITGSDSGNYSISTGGAPTTTADITPKELTIAGSFTANDKAFDDNKSATIDQNNLALIGVETGDNVTLSPVAEFVDKQVGTNKTVSLVGTTSISGADADNYSLSISGAPTTQADIFTGAVADGNSSVTANPATLTAGNNSTVTVTIKDSYNNPVEGKIEGDFNFAISGNAQVVSGSFSETSAGVYEIEVTNTTAETISVTVTADGTLLSDKPDITFGAGAISAGVSNVQGTSPHTADGSDASTITIDLKDQYGNVISGEAANIAFSGLSDAQAASVSETGTPGTYQAAVTNTTAENITVVVTAGGTQLDDQPSITFEAGLAAKFVISGNSTQLAGESQNLTITARDANGNTATAYSGNKGLTFSGSSASPDGYVPVITNSSGGLTEFSKTITIDFSNGVATVSSGANGRMILYNAGLSTIGVTDGTISETATLDVTVTAGDANKIAFTKQPTDADQREIISPEVAVELLDAYGNKSKEQGINISLQVNNGAALGGNTSKESDTNGEAIYDDLFVEEAGMYKLTASASGLKQTESDEFSILDIEAPLLTVDDVSTNNPTPTITGTTDEPAGSTVTVTIDGKTYTTTVNEDGSWSVEVTDELENKEYTVTASITDDSGNTTETTGTLVVNATDPQLVVDDQNTTDTTPIITGSTDQAAGSTVTVIIAGKTYTTTVNEDGSWSVEVTEELDDGEYIVTARITDDFGNTTEATGTLSIDATKPTLTVDNQNTGNPTPAITGSTDEPAGSTVTVVVNGKTYTATVGSDGNWSVSLTETLSEGEYTITATITDSMGNTTEATGTLEIVSSGADRLVIVSGNSQTQQVTTQL
ncbi:MAG: hypothetical protein FH748_11875 [Balneolaceae bacterium]|nr:hypothetical protein [Balneolaceae bacterium]